MSPLASRLPLGNENRAAPRKGHTIRSNRARAGGKENVPPRVQAPLPAFMQNSKDSAVTTDNDWLLLQDKSEIDKARNVAADKRVWPDGTLQCHLDWLRPGGDLCAAAKVRKVDMAWVSTLMSKMQNCPWVVGMLPMLAVIHPDQCPEVADFDIDKFDKGEYDLCVLGGNHSLLARDRL